jgi:FlaG/FlaF family flagellin (archaellin)
LSPFSNERLVPDTNNRLDGGLRSVVAGFIYRTTTNSWDIAIDPSGVYNPTTSQSASQPEFTTNLGFGNNGGEYSLSITHRVGVGYTFTVSSVSLTFQRAVGIADGVRAIDFYNAIMVAAQAQGGDNRRARLTDSSFTFETVDGIDGGGSVCPSSGNLNVAAFTTRFDNFSVDRKWLVADDDLSHTNWQFTAKVKVERPTSGADVNKNEDVTIAIYTVPLPDRAFINCRGERCN